MRERPILSSAAMVRAILAGTKTQTRRVVKADLANAFDPPRGPEDVAAGYPWFEDGDGNWHKAVDCCPYGQPGDRLWVREPGRVVDVIGGTTDGVAVNIKYIADGVVREVTVPHRLYRDGYPTAERPKWVQKLQGIPNGIFREAARIFLEIVSVRVERLEDITEADARAEGFESRAAFLAAFRTIYGIPEDVDLWLWVVEFKRVEVHNAD